MNRMSPFSSVSDLDLKETRQRITKTQQLQQLLNLYRPEKKSVLISSLALAVSTAITMAVPASMGIIIDLTTSASSTASNIDALSVKLGMLFLTGAGANVVRIHVSNVIGERIALQLRQDTFSSIVHRDMIFFDHNRTGELVNRLSADTTLVGKVLSDNVVQGVRSAAQGLGSISMLFITCPKLAMLMCSIVPATALGAGAYGRYVQRLTKDVQDQLANATTLAEERIGNIRTVKWFHQEAREELEHQRTLDTILGLVQKRSLASAGFFGAVDLSFKMSLLAVLSVGGNMVSDGMLSIGDLTSFLLYTIYVGFSFAGVSTFYSELMKALGASTRIFELMDDGHLENRSIARPMIHHSTQQSTIDLDFPAPAISFDQVHFRYPSRPNVNIFSNLSFDIQQNETVALVGPSGCGKTTISELLGGFYALDQGQIRVNGKILASMHPLDIRQSMACVSQEPPLFAMTIEDNIGYGLSDENDPDYRAKIVQAATHAQAHDFIQNLPDQYQTQVGEHGQMLSGGQKQRIAIARALVGQPEIVILDEATSALDGTSESLLRETLGMLKLHRRTVLVISHRLSTIQFADRILVLSDSGSIVQQGTFDQLRREEGGVFRTLFSSSDSSRGSGSLD